MRVPADAPAFCKGFIPLVSFLSGRPNPTPYTFLLTPGYNTDSQAREWMASLDARNIQWGFSERFTPRKGDLVDDYLLRVYRPVWNNEEYVLWQRIPPGAGGE
jgi:hypothetical protein